MIFHKVEIWRVKVLKENRFSHYKKTTTVCVISLSHTLGFDEGHSTFWATGLPSQIENKKLSVFH